MSYFIPSSWDRFWARGVDGLLILLLCLPVWGLFFDQSLADGEFLLPWAALFYLVGVHVLYEALSYWVFGQTFGKWVFSLAVVDDRDPAQEISLSRCLLRALVGRMTFYFSWAPQCFAFFRYDRTHLADWVAQTRVVGLRSRVKPARLHPWWGIFLVFLFLQTGISSASWILSNLEWDRGGVFWPVNPLVIDP